MRIYLAGPLFALGEREFNKKLAQNIENKIPGSNVILPQEFLLGFTGKKEDFFLKMFQCCINGIENSDLVIAILDGSNADSGTCVEIGYAYAIKKPIIGVRTDFRNCEDRGVSLMVSTICSEYLFYPDPAIQFDTLINELVSLINKIGILQGQFEEQRRKNFTIL